MPNRSPVALPRPLSIGVTANLMLAQMEYDVASGAGQAKHDTATALGLGATVGLRWTLAGGVSLGAAWESRSSFQDFSFHVPARPDPFSPGSTIPGGTDRLALDQPQSVTVGASFAPWHAVLLAADVQWIDWSATLGDGLPRYTSDPATTGALPFDMGWHDQWVLKLGAQVTPVRALDLRAGWNYGKAPLDRSRAFENLAFPAVADHHLTAGAGVRAGQALTVNVAAVYAPAASISGANASPPPPMGGTGQGIAAYRTEMSQLQIDLGVAYRF
ncbi:OmpP1/FadL family transporter [Anaeromyxobacter sp. PSR-1]|uniref:OmpP1/FadL family transporter n=1 Tax=Anaeromyxobacter sp. PSR-1 TaxID=1300915 RepID=UPI0005DFBD23|nr:outer membrane protein transport protein [Anaeromyxobacter sp. PSR-1]GAO02211.1 outer membrane protein transport protein [Anaeromyxobacter sp. PSR-1]